MSEFERKLTTLHPAAVDRDGLLFAAGKASATSPRWWRRVCSLLAVTQAVTLGLWLGERRSTPPASPPLPPVVPTDPPPASPPDPSSYLALRHTWDAPRPPGTRAAPDAPPLTAGSVLNLPLEPGA